MTKKEFVEKYLAGSDAFRSQWLQDVTALCDDERKDSKIEGFKIARKLFEMNPNAFQEIITSLIEGTPPEQRPAPRITATEILERHAAQFKRV